MPDIKISGIEEVCRNLDGLPKSIVKQAFARALTAACVPIVQELNTRTPEDTGDLVDHLMTDIAIDSEGRGGMASIGFGKEGWKARLVEYGHRAVGHRPAKKDTGKMVQSHAFMRPAVAAAAEDAIEAFSESITKSVNEGIAISGARVA
jgi:HK97 gp10 family phage protein